jgi:Protein of unknown function (DUF2789)
MRCDSLDPFIHGLRDLFGQLGLPDDAASIEAFIAAHRPLPAGVALADAAFWTPSQAEFLREEIADDADWAEIVDTLGNLLSA